MYQTSFKKNTQIMFLFGNFPKYILKLLVFLNILARFPKLSTQTVVTEYICVCNDKAYCLLETSALSETSIN